jgi:hypothetical protein
MRKFHAIFDIETVECLMMRQSSRIPFVATSTKHCKVDFCVALYTSFVTAFTVKARYQGTMFGNLYRHGTKWTSDCTCELCSKVALIRYTYYQQHLPYDLVGNDDRAEESFRSIDDLLYCFRTAPYWLSHLSQCPESFTIICNGKT